MAADRIKQLAREIGFDMVGICSAALDPVAGERLAHFLELGRHGDMRWMENRQTQRASPDALWADARSVIMLGLNYGPDDDPMAALSARDRAVISVYAQNKDYHDIVKKRLKALARAIHAELGGEVKIFVDTAPVMEKPLAAAAGIGWQGKHTNVVSRAKGSWLFLGAIFTTLDLPTDAAETDHCGSCRRCLDVCPTDAFPAPYQLDARRCISYLTIEHPGPIPLEFRAAIGNRIYGCDDCLAVCPWNKFAETAAEAAFHARDALKSPLLADLAGLDDQTFRTLFSGSPIKRIKRDRFIRNVLIAIGNSGEARYADLAAGLLKDPAPIVRGAAIWALAQLDRACLSRQADSHRARERDPDVLCEWRSALANAPASATR